MIALIASVWSIVISLLISDLSICWNSLWSRYSANKYGAPFKSTNTFVLKDGLKHRQEFCNLINRIWGLGVWCEIAPEANIEAMNNPDEHEVNNEVYDNDTEEVTTNE